MLFLPDGTPEQMAWYEDLLWRSTTAEAAAALYGALLARELDGSDVLARTSVPVLVSHGRDDMIVLPSMAERTLAACPAANSPTSHAPRDHHSPHYLPLMAVAARAHDG